MELVLHLLLAVFMPGVDHSGFRVPHVHDSIIVIKTLTVFLGVSVQFAVDQVNRILFISRPQSPFLNPDSVEIAASNHEVAAFLDDKLGIDLDDTTLATARCNHQEV